MIPDGRTLTAIRVMVTKDTTDIAIICTITPAEIRIPSTEAA